MTTHKIQELIDEHKEDMKILELFSGTGSITKVCKELDYKVVSVDLEKKFKPDICIDILKWDYKKDFKEGDHLLLTGDPALIGVACSIVSDITNGKYNLLKWDKQERKYYPISINLYEKGEIDDN